jgi:hypothetical protein
MNESDFDTEVIFDLPDADISNPPDWCEEILSKDWGFIWDDLPEAPEW